MQASTRSALRPDEPVSRRVTPVTWTGGYLPAGALPVLSVLVLSFFFTAIVFTHGSANALPESAVSQVEQPTLSENPSSNPENTSQDPQPGAKSTGGISSIFTPEVQYWAEKLILWSKQFDLDPNLAATVMQIESCGSPDVGSSAGAMGLFQVMPFHFNRDEDPYHPGTNARRGLAYLQLALQKNNQDIRLALASYNAGITGASRPENQWPAETRRYVYWGYQIYLDAVSGSGASSRLQDWLAAGGSSLCATAREHIALRP